MNDKYAGWKIPIPPVSTHKWTPEDWERYTEKAGICAKCIEDARKAHEEAFYADYTPAPGTKFRIDKAVSAMEGNLMKSRPDETYTFAEWDRRNGYFICTDKIGERWPLHPEALQQITP